MSGSASPAGSAVSRETGFAGSGWESSESGSVCPVVDLETDSSSLLPASGCCPEIRVSPGVGVEDDDDGPFSIKTTEGESKFGISSCKGDDG
jgi:hypothetical protein